MMIWFFFRNVDSSVDNVSGKHAVSVFRAEALNIIIIIIITAMKTSNLTVHLGLYFQVIHVRSQRKWNWMKLFVCMKSTGIQNSPYMVSSSLHLKSLVGFHCVLWWCV
jgi:hypothetical protein